MKKKYRTVRFANINFKYLQIIQEKYFPTIPISHLMNEFTNRYIKENFKEVVKTVDEVVENDKRQRQQIENI